MFGIGEIVKYKGKKWEVADRMNGNYALWSSDEKHKKEVEGWIAEEYLVKVEGGEV